MSADFTPRPWHTATMSDENVSAGSGPLATEVAEALERRRLAVEQAAAVAAVERRESAVNKLRYAAWGGALCLVFGNLVLAVGLKSFGEDVTEGFVEDAPLVAIWFGALVTLGGLLLMVRAVVGWAVQEGMDASGR